MDLAKVVSCTERYEWRSSVWELKNDSHPEIAASELPYHVVAYDYGVKLNILRMLVDRGCRLTIVPAKTSAADVLAMKPDGVFLANGPGDPEPCDYAIAAIREIVESGTPTTVTVSVAGLTAGDISRTSPTVVTEGLISSEMVRSLSEVPLFSTHSWTLKIASRGPSCASR